MGVNRSYNKTTITLCEKPGFYSIEMLRRERHSGLRAGNQANQQIKSQIYR